jgi:magnesium-transporting ATPase (P-type)
MDTPRNNNSNEYNNIATTPDEQTQERSWTEGNLQRTLLSSNLEVEDPNRLVKKWGTYVLTLSSILVIIEIVSMIIWIYYSLGSINSSTLTEPMSIANFVNTIFAVGVGTLGILSVVSSSRGVSRKIQYGLSVGYIIGLVVLLISQSVLFCVPEQWRLTGFQKSTVLQTIIAVVLTILIFGLCIACAVQRVRYMRLEDQRGVNDMIREEF